MNKEALLQAFGFYDNTTEFERQGISDAAYVRSLMVGDPFLRAGEPAGDFGLVVRGDIRVFRTAPHGREVTLYHVRDGQACLEPAVGVARTGVDGIRHGRRGDPGAGRAGRHFP